MYFWQSKTKVVYTFLIVILLSIVFFNVVYGLSTFPIYSWDEARHGVSAYEMLKKGNFVVNTYRNKIDYWNLKPPLSFWATMAGYKIAGFNALGLRLFSAVSAILTFIIITVFTYKKHGISASILTTMTLATCTQFLINHSARTGDADSLFVFLFTVSMLSMLLSEQNIHWLYVTGIGFSLAFLTKSWHAGNIAIILCLYLLITGMYKKLLLRNWLFLCLCMLLPIFCWGIIRYQYDGIEFFKNMVAYDLLKRSSHPIEGHIGDHSYYFEIMWRFSSLWVMVFIGLAAAHLFKSFPLKIRNVRYHSFYIGTSLWLLVPFILYSMAETKIRWYILPVYPALSVIIGTLACSILKNGKFITKIVLSVSMLLVSFHYESQIISYLFHPIPKLHLNLIQKIQPLKEIKGYSLFVYPHSKRIWPQNAVLAAELFGDLKVKNGDFDSFLKKDKALLMLKKGDAATNIIARYHLSILAANKWGYIVCKKGTIKHNDVVVHKNS